jgi:hypothetical protein
MKALWISGAIAVLAAASFGSQAMAWGDVGHRMIGSEALRALPDGLPAFLKTPQTLADVGEFSREPDRWRGAGKVHDSDRDPAHYIDLDDEGKTLSGLTLDQLPTTRSDFDAATRAKGIEPYNSGYLPYATIDAYQQVVKDFGYWRVLTYLISKETDATRKAYYQADLKRREEVIKRDIGILSHYVGDATQPMHVSIHVNGWGNYPNPEGYTSEKIHWPIEGTFVSQNIKPEDIRPLIAPVEACATPTFTACETQRLKRSFGNIIPLFKMEKAGDFKTATPQGKAYIVALLARGASDLRDTVNDAWNESKTVKLGFPGRPLDDFVTGKVTDPWRDIYGE